MIIPHTSAETTMSLTNMDTLEQRYMQYNPTDLRIMLAASYNEFDVLGSSFKPVQYQNTDNVQYSFTLTLLPETLADFQQYTETIRFLSAMFYPPESGSSPPDMLFVWPNYISCRAKAKTAEFTHTHYNKQGTPVIAQVSVSLFNVRNKVLLGPDARAFGWVD